MGQFSKPRRKEDRKFLDEIKKQPCAICGATGCGFNPVDPSHIQSRGAGGPDESWNVFPMCRLHHMEWHRIGCLSFLARYPKFFYLLKVFGWTIENGRLFREKIETQ